MPSCNKFLDIKPVSNGIAVENSASDSIVYKDAEAVEAALGGCYADFKNENTHFIIFYNKVFKIEIRYFLECTLSITKVDLLFSTIDNSYNAR